MKDKIITYGVLIALGAVAFAYFFRKGFMERLKALNTHPDYEGYPVFTQAPLINQWVTSPLNPEYWREFTKTEGNVLNPFNLIPPVELPDPGIIPPSELNKLGIQRLKDSETYRKSMALTWYSHLQTGDSENARYVESQFVAAGYQVREVLASLKTNLTVNN